MKSDGEYNFQGLTFILRCCLTDSIGLTLFSTKMSADIQLSVPHINSKLVVELCTASLKHILFIRELIPQPYETISQTDVSELTCHRPSMRKIEAFANHFASIEDDLRILSSFIGDW